MPRATEEKRGTVITVEHIKLGSGVTYVLLDTQVLLLDPSFQILLVPFANLSGSLLFSPISRVILESKKATECPISTSLLAWVVSR